MEEDGKVIIGTELKTDEFDKQLKKLERRKTEKKVEIDATVQNIEQTKQQLDSIDKQLKELKKDYETIIKEKEKYEKLILKPNEQLTQEDKMDIVAYELGRGDNLTTEALDKIDQLTLKQEKLKSTLEEQNTKLVKQQNAYEDINDKIEAINNKSEVGQNISEAFEKIMAKARETGKELDAGEIKQALTNLFSETESKMQQLQPLFEKYSELITEYFSLTDKSKGALIYESDIKDAERLKQQLQEIVEQIEKITGEKISIAGIDDIQPKLPDIKSNLKDIGKSITRITKKIIAWGLALFGVRSAYSAITYAMNVISGQDEQLKADIEYMKNAIAYALEPVVRTIVDLAKQLMQYISYIVYMWTGKNIFANAEKSLKGANTQASKLAKTLAGFDEMNILNDSSSGGGGGVATPSFSLTNPEKIQPPEWLTWIVQNKDLILSTLTGIGVALGLINLGLSPIISIGIGLMIAGLVYALQGLIKYLNDPSFKNFGKILQGIGVALFGLALIIGNIPLAVASALILIVGTITKYWEDIKKYLQKGIDWLKNKSEVIKDKFGLFGQFLYDTFVDKLQAWLNYFDKTFTNSKQILDGIIQFIKGVFSGNWQQAWEGIKQIFSGVFSGLWNIAKLVFDSIWAVIKNAINKIKEAFENGINFIKNLFYDLLDVVYNVANRINDAVWNIKNGISGAKDRVGDFFGNIGSGIRDIFGFAKGGIVVPKLASGGIINRPGRGVPITSAVGGERGMEGVIPLTDSQQMALLGEMIGKYITINANITNTMNGRVISRELQKINNESDFAFNR